MIYKWESVLRVELQIFFYPCHYEHNPERRFGHKAVNMLTFLLRFCVSDKQWAYVDILRMQTPADIQTPQLYVG